MNVLIMILATGALMATALAVTWVWAVRDAEGINAQAKRRVRREDRQRRVTLRRRRRACWWSWPLGHAWRYGDFGRRYCVGCGVSNWAE